MLWEHKPQAIVSTFSSSPKFSLWCKKENQLVYFDHRNVNSLCSRHHYVNSSCWLCVSINRVLNKSAHVYSGTLIWDYNPNIQAKSKCKHTNNKRYSVCTVCVLGWLQSCMSGIIHLCNTDHCLMCSYVYYPPLDMLMNAIWN